MGGAGIRVDEKFGLIGKFGFTAKMKWMRTISEI